MEVKKPTYDIKRGLELYMPSFLELLGNQKISWRSINKVVSNYTYKVRLELLSTGKPVIKEATFYTIVVNKLKGITESDAQFDFYNELFKSLLSVLDEQEQRLIHKILKKILLQPDKDYLNFIGELATLNFYKRNTNLRLLNIEEQIVSEQKKSVDFLFLNESDGIELLIEVVNIHFGYRESLTIDLLKKNIYSKLENKKKDTLINKEKNIAIQPVIWIKDFTQLELLVDLYQKENFQPDRTILPLSYVSFKDKEDKFFHRFGLLTEILNQ